MQTRPPAGLLFALTTRTDAKLPKAGLSAGGIPIVLRQLRQLQALGVNEVLVLAGSSAAALEARMHREARRLGLTIWWNATLEDLAEFARDRAILAIDEALAIDERLLEMFGEAAELHAFDDSPLVAQWRGKGGTHGGVAFFPPGSLDPVRLARFGKSHPRDCRVLAGGASCQATRFDFSAIETYSPPRRRTVPMLWRYLDNSSDQRTVTAELLAAAQKGCLDWPARFIHPPIENALTRLLLPTPVSPNMLSLAIFVAGLYAAWLFATGAVWTALILAIVLGPLDGVDGKLARTRFEFSRWGDLEHVGDKIVEYLWFLGIAYWMGTAWAWTMVALIVLFALAESLQGEIFRRLTGRQLDDSGPLERRFRLISGRRNTFMWTLLPFALVEAWAEGIVVIALYAVTTFFFTQIRFFVRLSSQFREDAEAVERNVARTRYRFLPEKPQPAE